MLNEEGFGCAWVDQKSLKRKTCMDGKGCKRRRENGIAWHSNGPMEDKRMYDLPYLTTFLSCYFA